MRVPRCAVALGSYFPNGMVVAWHGRGMACVNQTRPNCVNQIAKTQSKLLAAGMGAAWYYELVLIQFPVSMFVSVRYSSALLHRSVMAATFGLGST
jgi:hypothetical protein